jgi:hypothetical protein
VFEVVGIALVANILGKEVSMVSSGIQPLLVALAEDILLMVAHMRSFGTVHVELYILFRAVNNC